MNSEDVVLDENFDFEFGGAVDACADESFMPPALPDEVEKRIEAHIAAFDPLRWEICAPENNLNHDYFFELDVDLLGVPPEIPLCEPFEEVPGRPAWRNFRFGSHVLEDAYSILSRKIYEHDLGCLFATETMGDATCVTVCNYWRLTKRLDGPQIYIEVRDFDCGGWMASNVWGLAHIRLLPGIPKRAMAREVLHRAVLDFAYKFNGDTAAERATLAAAHDFPLFYSSFIPEALADAKVRSLEKRLGVEKLNSLSETLSKIIWKCLIDPTFIKIVGYARMLRDVSISDYITMAQSHLTWIRLFQQERKLLPVLSAIPMDELHKPEPFSIKRWTEEGVNMVSGQGKTRLSGPASYRALIATHPAIVRAWEEMSSRHGTFATLFDLQAIIADDGKIPQPVLWSILGALGSRVRGRLETEELTLLARLIREYVRECKRRRAMPEFCTYRNAIASIGLRQVLDWWVHAGRPADEPNRQTKWSGIERKSSQWHRVVWQGPSVSKDLVWESLVSACEVSGVDVVPLTSSDSLISEGKAMQHCVSTYDSMCMSGEYRIFSLKAKTGERTTLGLAQVGNRWNINQHFSAANGSISSSASAVGKEIARLYTKVERTAQKRYLPEEDIPF